MNSSSVCVRSARHQKRSCDISSPRDEPVLPRVLLYVPAYSSIGQLVCSFRFCRQAGELLLLLLLLQILSSHAMVNHASDMVETTWLVLRDNTTTLLEEISPTCFCRKEVGLVDAATPPPSEPEETDIRGAST